ncbi:putative transporter SVOPL isoform X1 [Mytilus galloprovincialis]|uniref:putative transporter SVOPL isoform X1 n=2 Tax=Mytilus galloprovincialis TaxID=29158 RepID=UPI003F7BE7D4
MESLLTAGDTAYSRPSRMTMKYTKLHTGESNGNVDQELEAIALLESESESSGGEMYTEESKKKHFTVEEAVEAVGFGWFQIRLYFMCGLFTAADSLEMMLLAVISPVLRCEWGLEHFHVAFITTVVFIGMCIMAPIWGAVGDRYGRQTTLYMVTFWIGYYGLLTTFSPSYYWILFLRCLVGGGLAGSPQSFALMAEYLPAKYRAKMLILGSVPWAVGTIFEVTVAAFTIPTLGWRWLLVFSAAPSFIMLVILKFLPESARYLVAAGDKDGAIKILQKAAKVNRASLPEGSLVQSKVVQRGEFKDLFSSNYVGTTVMLWVLWFATAFSYYGMVLASTEILQKKKTGESCSCNLLNNDDYSTMILSSFGELIPLPVNMFLIDRVGRKKMGAFNMGGCAFFFMLLQIPMPQKALTAVMFCVRGFSSGMFNFVYIYSAEVYPTNIRTLGIGAASSWARVGAMVTPFVAQVLLDQSLTAAVLVYGCVCSVAAICAICLPIETMGRALPHTT